MNPGDYPSYYPLDSWSFDDTNTWASDYGYPPVDFTNLNASLLGDGTTLGVDSTKPSWLHYNVYETDGSTNLTVIEGTLTFWFAPNWSSVSEGGTGPGDWAELFSVGQWTTNASYGYWGLNIDPAGTNVYFSAQDDSGSQINYLAAPISWTTNLWHQLTLTYSITNTALYVDGLLATNGPGMTVWPSTVVLGNGFYFGSDTNGQAQAHGMLDDVATFDVVMDTNTIAQLYYGFPFYINPLNDANWKINPAPSNPSDGPLFYNVISGQGTLTYGGSAPTCVTDTSVWLTNIVVSMVGSGTNATMNLTFTIEGGYDNYPYDVFANSMLGFGTNVWAWMGQGYHCNIYTLTNLPNTTCFLILGTPQDSDFDGLTDAYERLVSKTNPLNADTDGDGISDSDEILNGTNPLTSNPAWGQDTDGDGLPNAYETLVGWNPNSAEVAPGLPSYSPNPIQ
ncbi:MAG: LamG-like jellyroll fold domain-containing protein [Limisphaerales bacterium]